MGLLVTVGCEGFCGSWRVSKAGLEGEDAVVLEGSAAITFILDSHPLSSVNRYLSNWPGYGNARGIYHSYTEGLEVTQSD